MNELTLTYPVTIAVRGPRTDGLHHTQPLSHRDRPGAVRAGRGRDPIGHSTAERRIRIMADRSVFTTAAAAFVFACCCRLRLELARADDGPAATPATVSHPGRRSGDRPRRALGRAQDRQPDTLLHRQQRDRGVRRTGACSIRKSISRFAATAMKPRRTALAIAARRSSSPKGARPRW